MTNSIKAIINDKEILLSPDQDLLTSALQQSINFPHNCRLGGCGVCK